MYGERSRDPPPRKALCFRCGWTGTPDHAMLRDEQGDVALIITQKPCPKCGAQTTQLNEPKPPLPIQIITAVRDADLTPAQLLELADAVRDASAEISPRQLGEQVPAASTIITIASRAGASWMQVLGIVVTAVAATVGTYVIHTDAQQAHRDAEQSREQLHQDAEQARRESREERQDARRAARKTGSLSDEEIRKIARQIEGYLERDAAP